MNASQSISNSTVQSTDDMLEVQANSGDFDLRGYEVARGQYFSDTHRITVTFTIHEMKFSTASVRQFPSCSHVEILIHPSKMMFAARPTDKDNRNHIQWSKVHDAVSVPRTISGNAFLPVLFEILGWNTSYRYRATGQLLQNGTDCILIYNLRDTEVFISKNCLEETHTSQEALSDDILPFTTGAKKDIVAYPADWASNFGENYYAQAYAPEIAEFSTDESWHTQAHGTPYYKKDDLDVSSPETLQSNINKILQEIKQEDTNG